MSGKKLIKGIPASAQYFAKVDCLHGYYKVNNAIFESWKVTGTDIKPKDYTYSYRVTHLVGEHLTWNLDVLPSCQDSG